MTWTDQQVKEACRPIARATRFRLYLVHTDSILLEGCGEGERLDDGVGGCVGFRAFVNLMVR